MEAPVPFELGLHLCASFHRGFLERGVQCAHPCLGLQYQRGDCGMWAS